MIPDDPDAQARLFYLAALLLVVAGGLVHRYRGRLSTALQHAAIWLLIILGLTLAYGFKDQLASALYPDAARGTAGQTIALSRSSDGHFYARVMVNGTEIRFMIDTGATSIVLSQADARRIGIDTGKLSYVLPSSTANGTVMGAGVVLDRVELGGIVDRDVRAVVNGGEMSGSLLGMAYLDRFRSFKVEGDSFVLMR
jgi:aspartyl protease family protein